MKTLENKLSGSYYTPYKTVRFMKRYLVSEQKMYSSVLEPSAGDGRFIDVFEEQENIQRFTAVELIEGKARQLKEKGYSGKVSVISGDFLDFSQRTEEKYQLIIGNPPYINIKNMEDTSKEKAKAICRKYQLPESLMKNIWVAFLLAAVSCLEKGGAVFFVLPLEFLQVQYAEKIRIFLEDHFDTIHILSFKERMFPEIEQEACLVYLTNEGKKRAYIDFKMYQELDAEVPCYYSHIERNKPLKKWTNAILSDEDIDLFSKLGSGYQRVNELCDASPGIVTGANHEFILTGEQVEQLNCQEYVLPVISKSSMLRGKFVLTDNIVRWLGEQGDRIYLLNLAHVEEQCFSEELERYLSEIGEKKNSAEIKLRERYKCKNRTPWYGVPIIRNGELFFFKRYDKIPRVCVNEADIYTTDIAYNMRLKEGIEKESLAFCFYNSLTLAQCEYYGRYYAGGVSELTPSEFKKLVIPYRKVKKGDILKLARMFEEETAIEKIVAFVNSRTIGKDWEPDVILKIDEMRKRLIERRIS